MEALEPSVVYAEEKGVEQSVPTALSLIIE
jgi:hypothetical protein